MWGLSIRIGQSKLDAIRITPDELSGLRSRMAGRSPDRFCKVPKQDRADNFTGVRHAGRTVPTFLSLL